MLALLFNPIAGRPFPIELNLFSSEVGVVETRRPEQFDHARATTRIWARSAMRVAAAAALWILLGMGVALLVLAT